MWTARPEDRAWQCPDAELQSWREEQASREQGALAAEVSWAGREPCAHHPVFQASHEMRPSHERQLSFGLTDYRPWKLAGLGAFSQGCSEQQVAVLREPSGPSGWLHQQGPRWKGLYPRFQLQ